MRRVGDDVSVGMWELIFFFPRIISLFVKDDDDWVNVASCVESAVVGVSVCICDKSEGFVLRCL